MTGAVGYVEDRFRAMGTDVTVIVAVHPRTNELLASVRKLFAEQETRFSRFRTDSELSELNRGTRHRPSPDFRSVLERAAHWHSVTGGDFDPAVFPDLLSAGYDESFERVNTRPLSSPCSVQSPANSRLRYTFADIITDSRHGFEQIMLPAGLRIDLSGIVKGWTVDRATELLEPLGDFAIDAGGDIAARGDSPDGEGWYVGLEDPLSPGSDHAYVLVTDGAVATSGTYRRHWSTTPGKKAHHLIDPRTGRPTETPTVAVSVTGKSVEECEIIAKAVLIRGPLGGLPLLDSTTGVEGMLTNNDRSRLSSSNWAGQDAYRAISVAGGGTHA